MPGRTRFAGALAMAVTTLLCVPPTASAEPPANALIMDGTTFPNPSQGYMASAIGDFIAPTAPHPAGYVPVAVMTPEQILGINRSVDVGAANLEAVMAQQNQPFVVFGFSQSTVISMKVKAELSARKAAGQPVPDVTFVGIGVGNRPNGGIAQRFSGVTIPVFDFTFNGAAPTDPEFGFTTIDIARQYDGLADTPQFPVNVVADVNAILGIVFAHALYGQEVSLDPASPKYVPGTVKQQYGDTTYYWIPTADLPLFDPLRLAAVPEPAIDVVEPFFKVLVEAGYDRSVPFGEPTPAQLIPVIDPLTLGLQLAGAVLDGADNAAKLVGVGLPGHPALAQRVHEESEAAAALAAPYRAQVSAFNRAVNPFEAFAAVEGPVATQVNGVINGLGVPAALNRVVDSTLFPVTAWAERNVLFPQPDSPPRPLAGLARRVLGRVAPELAPDDTVTLERDRATTTERRSATTPERRVSPSPERIAAKATNRLRAERSDELKARKASDERPTDKKLRKRAHRHTRDAPARTDSDKTE